MENKFKIGDVVSLNSGSEPMTVVGFGFAAGDNDIRVAWQPAEGGGTIRELFPPEALTLDAHFDEKIKAYVEELMGEDCPGRATESDNIATEGQPGEDIVDKLDELQDIVGPVMEYLSRQNDPMLVAIVTANNARILRDEMGIANM